jgi:hypothetical protein
MTDPKVYPITSSFSCDMDNVPADSSLDIIRKQMVEFIGEYEHGTADITDLIPCNPQETVQALNVAADVLLDFFMYISGYQKSGEPYEYP